MDLLTQTINDFAQWRNSRTTRGQTPPHLKKQVATLADVHSRSELCQALNINNRLIERCLQEHQVADFVELSIVHEPSVGELKMELNVQGINAVIKGLPQDIASMVLCLGAAQ